MRVKVQFEVDIPDESTFEETDLWLRYSLNDRGCMPANNPLEGYDVDPVHGTFEWEYV